MLEIVGCFTKKFRHSVISRDRKKKFFFLTRALVRKKHFFPTDMEEKEEKHHKAHSFWHFNGPVEGHHQKVEWTDKHGHKYHDYVAHPKYKFSYGVEDHHTHDFHGQKEYRDG